MQLSQSSRSTLRPGATAPCEQRTAHAGSETVKTAPRSWKRCVQAT